MGREDPFAGLLSLPVPVKVYRTEHSGGFYPGMAQIAAEIIPGAELRELPGLNHIVPLESPETVAAIAEALRGAR
jgi:pimeloyl-ACP methyl ester carboxylesterase